MTSGFSTYDLIICVFMLVMMLIGWKRGFVKSVFSVCSLILSVVITYALKDVFADFFAVSSAGVAITGHMAKYYDGPLADKCAMAVIFFVSTVILYILVRVGLKFAKGILNALGSLPLIKSVNQLLGLIVNVIIGIIWLLVFTNLLYALPATHELVSASRIAQMFGLIIV